MSYTIWPDGIGGDVLDDIHRERARQEELCRKGKFPHTAATDALTMPEKLAVLAEEFGEVAKEVTEAINVRVLRGSELTVPQRQALRAELIQVAAVCAAWAESLGHDARLR
jgi:NTP pyrophosphatase (non-canonical NTP hydrolase)